ITEALRRVPEVSASEIDDVILGCAMPEGEQGLNVARIASLRAGIPVSASAVTINRFCSSGLQAIAFAAERIMCGFASAIVTAGNSSQMSDGAAAVLVVSAARARELGLVPLGRFVAFATAGVEPERFGIGPVPAIRKALKIAGLRLDQMDLVELNEAFAAQALACLRELPIDSDRLNVNGGAIALGHPLGCTGAKLTTTLVYEMKRRQARYGMVTMCVGGGMGAAGIFERM